MRRVLHVRREHRKHSIVPALKHGPDFLCGGTARSHAELHAGHGPELQGKLRRFESGPLEQFERGRHIAQQDRESGELPNLSSVSERRRNCIRVPGHHCKGQHLLVRPAPEFLEEIVHGRHGSRMRRCFKRWTYTLRMSPQNRLEDSDGVVPRNDPRDRFNSRNEPVSLAQNLRHSRCVLRHDRLEQLIPGVDAGSHGSQVLADGDPARSRQAQALLNRRFARVLRIEVDSHAREFDEQVDTSFRRGHAHQPR